MVSIFPDKLDLDPDCGGIMAIHPMSTWSWWSSKWQVSTHEKVDDGGVHLSRKQSDSAQEMLHTGNNQVPNCPREGCQVPMWICPKEVGLCQVKSLCCAFFCLVAGPGVTGSYRCIVFARPLWILSDVDQHLPAQLDTFYRKKNGKCQRQESNVTSWALPLVIAICKWFSVETVMLHCYFTLGGQPNHRWCNYHPWLSSTSKQYWQFLPGIINHFHALPTLINHHRQPLWIVLNHHQPVSTVIHRSQPL